MDVKISWITLEGGLLGSNLHGEGYEHWMESERGSLDSLMDIGQP